MGHTIAEKHNGIKGLNKEHYINRWLGGLDRSGFSKGIVKKPSRALKIMNNAINITWYSMLALAAGWTAKEAFTEYNQEFNSQNQIIDYSIPFMDSSIVIKNRETRTEEEVLSDVENAVINIEGMEQIITTSDSMSYTDKENFINNIIETMNKAGGTEIKGFKLVNESGYRGYYASNLNNPYVTINSNYVSIDEDYFNGGSEYFENIVFTTIHEMLHAIDMNNLVKSDSLSKLDKKIYYADSKEDDRYYTKFVETNVHLRVELIEKEIYEKYGLDYNKRSVFVTIIEELNDKTDYKYADMSYSEAIKADMIERLDLSQAEILKIEDTYYYKDMESLVSDYKGENYFTMSANDRSVYVNVIEDVKEYVNVASTQLESDSFNSNRAYLKTAISVRYDYDKYDEKDLKIMENFLVKNIDSIDEKSIEKYNLKSIVEAAETNDVSKIYKVEKLTETSILPDINYTAQDGTSFSIIMDEIEN